MRLENILYIITLIILVFIKPNRFENFDSTYIFNLSLVYFFIILVFIFKNRSKDKNWLRVDVLFIIGYTIVHFQIPFFESIGIEPERPSLVWVNKQVVNYATWMSLMSIVLWILGYNLIKKNKYFFSLNIKQKTSTVNFKLYDKLLFVFLILFLILVGDSLYNLEYDGGMSWGEGSNYVFIFVRSLLYLRIIYFFKNIEKDASLKTILKTAIYNKLFLIILSVFVLLFLLSGERGSVLEVALIIAGSYSFYLNPIPLRKLFLFIFIGAFVFTLIRFGRVRDATQVEDSNIFKRGYSNFKDYNKETNFTDELATSVRIQYTALDIVPDSHPYLYGISFFVVGAGVVPFGSTIVIDYFNIPDHYVSSSSFFTYYIRGLDAESGDGSELLSDIYINFGIYGAFFIMFLFGMFTAFTYRKMKQNDFIFVLINIVLLYSVLSMNRGMLFTPLKDIVYILFFNFIFTRILKLKSL